MAELTIVTNGRARELISFHDLTEKEQKEFDYIGEEDKWNSRFFRYRGNVYDISEFQPVPKQLAERLPRSWAGSDDDPRYNYYSSDSFFSGVVISLGDDGDYVVPGTYFS